MKKINLLLGIALLLPFLSGCTKEETISTNSDIAIVLAISNSELQLYKTKNGNGDDDKDLEEKDRYISVSLNSKIEYYTGNGNYQFYVYNDELMDNEKEGKSSLSSIKIGDSIRLEYFEDEPTKVARITNNYFECSNFIYGIEDSIEGVNAIMKNDFGDTKVQIKLSSLWFDNNYNVKQVPNLEVPTELKICYRSYWLYGSPVTNGAREMYYSFIPE